MEKIVIIGGGGFLKNIINYVETQGIFHIVGYVDIVNNGTQLGIVYLGNDDVLIELFNNGIKNAVMGVGFNLHDSNFKRKLVEKSKKTGFNFPAVISGSATVHRGVTIEEGCIIRDGAILQSGSYIERFGMIGDNVVISHDTRIGEYSHVVAGSTVGRDCIIGKGVFIGYGSTVMNEITIAQDTVIGAKSLVNRNIEEAGIYFGIPAKLKKS